MEYLQPTIGLFSLLALGAIFSESIKSIKIAQKDAIKRVFKKQSLKFRNFEIWKKDEENLGIIFTYFMLETILLGKLMKLNPFD